MILAMRKYLLLLLVILPLTTWGSLVLRDNMNNAAIGDYIVTAQNKVYTMLLVTQRDGDEIQIDEITVPSSKIHQNFSWRQWVVCKAPQNSSWVRYTIDLKNASMKGMYSFTKGSAYHVDEANNFLSKLLNLQLEPVPERFRKRVGPRASPGGGDWRPFWQPSMIVDGQVVPGVTFHAYRTSWPSDGSELSGKSIEIYVPEDGKKYPAYFPYWLQVSGVVGKARVRIIDSGTNLHLPQTENPQVVNKISPDSPPLLAE
jgi:hypothetical protein